MYYLAEITPEADRLRRLPLSRDQIMLLLVAINQLFLALDIYLAHSISGTIVPYEWIPIIYGAIAGVTLLIAGGLALRFRRAAVLLASVVFVSSIFVGLLGTYFHIARAAQPGAVDISDRLNLLLVIWAPPVLGPLSFAGVGLLGLSAVLLEDPADSGRLRIGRRYLALPYSKTRGYFLLVGLGILAALLSSVFDHARTGFENPWLWLPTVLGVFSAMSALAMGFIATPTKADIITYAAAMVLLVLLSMTGAALHIGDGLTASGVIVIERFIRGAPVLAPMLFANMGLIGLVALLPPDA